MTMYGPELRTYTLGAVISVLLGVGIGFGWHYFSDSGGGLAAATPAPSPLARQDAPNLPSSNPPAAREAPVLEDRRPPNLAHAQQPAHSRTRCTKGHVCGKQQPDRLVASSAPT
jgi:hypothetical protein